MPYAERSDLSFDADAYFCSDAFDADCVPGVGACRVSRHATGFSNGGMMVYSLTTEHPAVAKRIASVVAVSIHNPTPTLCSRRASPPTAESAPFTYSRAAARVVFHTTTFPPYPAQEAPHHLSLSRARSLDGTLLGLLHNRRAEHCCTQY